MKFKGNPNEVVKVSNPRPTEPRVIRFNSDGIYETHNKLTAARMKKRYPVADATEAQTAPDPEPEIKRCKKCGFTCANQGELMRHYKTEHPKEEK